MSIKEYFDHILLFLTGNRNVALARVIKRIIPRRGGGYLRLRITFIDKSQLELKEYVDGTLRKLSYSYKLNYCFDDFSVGKSHVVFHVDTSR